MQNSRVKQQCFVREQIPRGDLGAWRFQMIKDLCLATSFVCLLQWIQQNYPMARKYNQSTNIAHSSYFFSLSGARQSNMYDLYLGNNFSPQSRNESAHTIKFRPLKLLKSVTQPLARGAIPTFGNICVECVSCCCSEEHPFHKSTDNPVSLSACGR